MSQSRWGTSTQPIATRRPMLFVPRLCLVVCTLCPAAAMAAPAATSNPDAQMLLAQGVTGRAAMPAPAQFDADFLSGQGQRVDLSAFSHGNPMLAGSYRVDIYVNGRWQGRRDLQFKANAEGVVDACLGIALLEELGVDSARLQAAPQADTAAAAEDCVQLAQRMADAFGSYNSADLRYDLSIPQAFLRREARGYVNPALWDRGINAAFIGYSINAMDSDIRLPGGDRNRTAYLGLNMGLNMGGWQLRQDANLTWNQAVADGSHWQRIATYAQRGFPQVRGMLTIGEAFSNGELFDSVGYRGISLASDDRMLPDALRGYAPVVRGIAETNARVEIRQNQQLIYSTTVSPGSFVIEDLYPTGYGGDLEVTVVEADGRQRQFKVPFGSVPQMLRPGVSRYALIAGQVRDTRLLDEPWLLQGTYQRGIGNQLTLYAGSVLSEGYASALYGAGVATRWGAFATDVTHARSRLQRLGNRQGASMRLSYSTLFADTGTNLTLAAYRYSTRGFYSLQDALYARDVIDRGFAALPGGRQRSQLQLTLNQPLGQRWGALYLTGAVRDFYDVAGTSTQYQLGYNNTWRSLNFGFSALRSEQGPNAEKDTHYLLSVSMPLGRKAGPLAVSADLGMGDRGRYDSSRLGITGSLGVDNSFSYGLALSDSRDGGGSSIANAGYQGRYAALTASYGQSSDFRQFSVGATGSLVAHAGGVTLTPQRGDTMVVVQADGARDARLTNASGVRIDGRGFAVVPYAAPYRLTTVTLDPQDMSRGVELESSSQSVAPYAGAISFLRFETRKGRAVLMQLRDGDGQLLPFGAQARDAQGQPVGMVGQAGRLYVRSEQDAGHLQLVWGEGATQSCGIDYQLPAVDEAEPMGFVKVEAICR